MDLGHEDETHRMELLGAENVCSCSSAINLLCVLYPRANLPYVVLCRLLSPLQSPSVAFLLNIFVRDTCKGRLRIKTCVYLCTRSRRAIILSRLV